MDLGGVSAVGKVTDGDFSSYPEIPSKSVEVLVAKGYKSLFPIQ